MTEQELIEQLADKEHASWARWMDYLFSKCSFASDGAAMIPSELAARWNRQMCTLYADISEQEKQSDRDEVAHILPIIYEYASSRVTKSVTALDRIHRSQCDNSGDQSVQACISDLQRQVSLLHKEVFCTHANRPATRNQTLLGDVRELRRIVFSLQEESKSE